MSPFSSQIFTFQVIDLAMSSALSENCKCVMFTKFTGSVKITHDTIKTESTRRWKGKNPGMYLTEGIPGNLIYLFVIGQNAKAAFKIIGISHLWKSDVSRVKSRQSEARN